MIDDRIIWRKDKIGYEPPQEKWMEHQSFKDQVEKGIQVLVEHKVITDQLGQLGIKDSPSLAWKMAMIGNYLD
jgi:asparagine synthase (glutamine-hydrolysing)